MDIKKIPVSVIGTGSQPVGEDGQPLSYIDMPSDMATFEEPDIPEPDAVQGLVGAREAMLWLRRALADYGPGSKPQLAKLTALDEENRELVNQILGEGEVSIRYNGAIRARSQESVLAGVWRTLYLNDDDTVCYDILEVADVPHTVRMPDGRNRPINADRKSVPAELNNALAILVELEAQYPAFVAEGATHTINLTLLPLSDDELAFIDERLGQGPVDTLSRAYGKCQVSSTLTPNLWRVRFFNSMDTLILNTLEIADVPEAIRAAPEDLADSAQRLDDILTPYWSDVA
ncbi:MAG: hydrogenase expression/formation C-terminal domain-containing protein, partial [Woeseiaceae bacterium]